MADKNGKKTEATPNAAFDLKQYLPEGVSEADFRDSAERDPQVTPELLFREKIPLCGIPLGIDDMPHKADEKPWQAIVWLLQAPVLALDENKNEIVVEAGKRVVLGVSGGIKSFKIFEAMKRAISNEKEVYLVIMRVKGKEQVETIVNGAKTKADMWSFEMKVLWDKPIARGPKHAFSPRELGSGESVKGALPPKSESHPS